MYFKAVIYFVLVAISGIASVFFFMNSFGKKPGRMNKPKRKLSGKWSFLIGTLLLILTIYTGIGFVHKIYDKMKSTVTSLNNFPETVETGSSDTSNYVRVLKTYEPIKYKGRVPEQYYSNYGSGDWWRFPLVYPYSIYCIDIRYKGAIVNDSGKTNFENNSPAGYITPFFDSFIFNENYLIGKIVSDSGKAEIPGQFFIFDFRSGKSETISSPEALDKKLNGINFSGSRKFISVNEYSDRF